MIAWLLAAALAAAPVAPNAPVAATAPGIDPAPAVPTPEQVMALPPPLAQALRTQVVDRTPRGMARLERLVAFMYEPDGLGIQYRHDANHTVAETWATREANCLSFTLLTIALARAAGVEAYGQEIARTLSWFAEGDTLYFSNHVNAGIRIGRHEYTVDVGSDSLMTLDPPQRVDDHRLMAVYYSNRAADLLGRGAMPDAARFIDAALAADPGYATAWNNAGVLRVRSAQPEAAEQAFAHALELDRAHDGALMNLASLYTARGDTAGAARYRDRLERLRLRNPYHHFMQAVDAERLDDHATAARQYRRAIALYDAEHRFHSGLARALLHLGDARGAGRALQRAHDLSKGDMQARYQAKLDLLRRKGL
jgi:tetratricopeptide (TPR) repeat protein